MANYTVDRFEGDVVVRNDLTTGGDHQTNGNATVDGDLKVKGTLRSMFVNSANVGIFSAEAKLKAAYPSPKVGMYAAVGTSLPLTLYVCETAGTWKATTMQFSTEVTADMVTFRVNREQTRAEGVEATKADKDDTYTKDEVDTIVERIDNDIEGVSGDIDAVKARVDEISQLQLTNVDATANGWGTLIYNKVENGGTASVVIYDDSDQDLEILGDQDTLLGTVKLSTDGTKIDINASCGHGYFSGVLSKSGGAWTKGAWKATYYDDWRYLASSARHGLMSKEDKTKLDGIAQLQLSNVGATANDWGTLITGEVENNQSESVSIYDNSDEELEILGDQDTLLGTVRVTNNSNTIEINASCGHGYFYGLLNKSGSTWAKGTWSAHTYDEWRAKLDRLSNEDITKLLALINN